MMKRSTEKGFDADILSPAGWRAAMVICGFAITGVVLLSIAGQAPNRKTSPHGVEATTRAGPQMIESVVAVRDVPTDREKIVPEAKVADAPSPGDIAAARTREKPKPHPDDGYYYATVKVDAYQSMVIRRKCVDYFDYPEPCSLPPDQRRSRPIYLN